MMPLSPSILVVLVELGRSESLHLLMTPGLTSSDYIYWQDALHVSIVRDST